MQFPDASATSANMLYPQDGNAFDLLSRFIDHEYVDPSDREMRGILASIGIIKDRSFSPDAPARDLLDKAARTASCIGHAISYQPSAMVPNALYYANRHWINPFSTNATFTADTYNIVDAHRLLPLCLLNQPRHGRQRRECEYQIYRGLRGRRRELPSW
jgi:hypothetical protein